MQDVRRKASWYPSDFLDALHPQCVSAVLYVYLATVTNAITFGGLLGEATDGAQVGGWEAGLPSVFHQPCPTPPLVSMGGLRRLPGNLGPCADRDHCCLLGGAGKLPGHGSDWSCLLPDGWPAPHHP